ncbi:amy, partial [Symbiodinium pilosum]
RTFFYPLSTDPSIARDPIPEFVIADIPSGPERTDLTIRAKNPVTEWFEVGSTHRNYLAAMHDACELNAQRTMCLPVPEKHPDYQALFGRMWLSIVTEWVPDCCYATVANGDGTYSQRSSRAFECFLVGLPFLKVCGASNADVFEPALAIHAVLPVISKVDETISFEQPGHLVIDYWDSDIPCCPELWTRQLIEKDKFYSIKVEWKEMQGNAQLRLMWGITGKRKQIIPGANLWRGAPLETAPFRIVVHPGPPSVLTSGLLEPLHHLRTGALDTLSNTVNSTDVQFEALFYPPSYTNATDVVLLEPGNYTLELSLKGFLEQSGAILAMIEASSPIRFVAVQVENRGLCSELSLLQSPDTNCRKRKHTKREDMWHDWIYYPCREDDVLPQMCTVARTLEFCECGARFRGVHCGSRVETNFTLQLRDAFGHYTTATSITKLDFGSYLISYTGLRAGVNLLTVKVNGLLIRGHEEQIIYDPPVQGQNSFQEAEASASEGRFGRGFQHRAIRLPAECTTGVTCGVVFHLRDTYGNRMLDDYHSQLALRLLHEDCVVSDSSACDMCWQGHCFQLFGEMHAAGLYSMSCGNFVLRISDPAKLTVTGRLLINGQDASYALWAVLLEDLGVYSLEGVPRHKTDINATTSTMEGPGRLLEGNVVGTPVPILVQLKDQYGNNRIVTGSDFTQRRNGIVASLLGK